MAEWKSAFHAIDDAQDDSESGELDILDGLRVNDYLFRTGDWNMLPLPPPNDVPLPENEVLKKIVSYILGTLFPPPPPDPILPPPEFGTAIALCGVNFTWKPTVVRQLLMDISDRKRFRYI